MPTRHDLEASALSKRPLSNEYYMARELREGTVRREVLLAVRRAAIKLSKVPPKPSERSDCKENATS